MEKLGEKIKKGEAGRQVGRNKLRRVKGEARREEGREKLGEKKEGRSQERRRK